MMQMVEDTLIEHAHTKPLLPSQLIRYREVQVPDGRSTSAHRRRGDPARPRRWWRRGVFKDLIKLSAQPRGTWEEVNQVTGRN